MSLTRALSQLVFQLKGKVMTVDSNLKLQVTPTAIPDVLIMEPKVFGDNRGWFAESFNAKDFAKATGLDVEFVQDNHSFSRQWTLRGMHYQLKHTQGKLVRVTAGSVFDVVVDLRKDSATFGQWAGEELSSENHKQLWVPPGFAHGFIVISDSADVIVSGIISTAAHLAMTLKNKPALVSHKVHHCLARNSLGQH